MPRSIKFIHYIGTSVKELGIKKSRLKNIKVVKVGYSVVTYLFLINPALCQSLNSMLNGAINTSEVTVGHGDSVECFHLMEKGKKVYAYTDRFYTWYGNQRVKTTQGGYDGRLMDGKYTLFNRNKDLLEKGLMKKGIRIGEWRAWHFNGKIKKIERWNRGNKEGHFFEYSLDGNLERTGHYRKSKLHGSIYTYNPDGKAEKTKYKDGKLIENRKVARKKKSKENPSKKTIDKKLNTSTEQIEKPTERETERETEKEQRKKNRKLDKLIKKSKNNKEKEEQEKKSVKEKEENKTK